ncbi:cysteine synthase A [Pseudemcibacter aquimaris]|uniref:cysteine synthase A n=1 Tax=Pseudemcibacter aquimaris TaxID=2857064 RepID=UPI0020139C78|nr:cysteine synthase A [Pseudemcibacter aquimaris]MCC3859969.1 cysteine synthase A [Pseudemcibacter aquimaris]WDU57301.1 cysteine synthase A [Pseudemcibacter aquimaris]
MIYQNISETIGNTPVIKINKMAPAGINLYIKLESFNPGGSVKDRLALAIIEDAEKSGALKPGQTVVEATSGNTGIALAMVCAAKGYPFVATMVETFSVERRKIMRALGAKVILTPAADKASGMVKRAEELAEEHGWFLARQFENPANPQIHRDTTAVEILNDFDDQSLDYFVCGWGTGGTVTGVGEVIKAKNPETNIICYEPEQAQMMNGQGWNPHKIQGVVPNFIPEVLNEKAVDQLITVTDEDAKNTALKLATEEGIFVGLSAGGSMAAALKVAENAPDGSTILALLPDTGERYLSTYLFEELAEGSDDDFLTTAAE